MTWIQVFETLAAILPNNPDLFLLLEEILSCPSTVKKAIRAHLLVQFYHNLWPNFKDLDKFRGVIERQNLVK